MKFRFIDWLATVVLLLTWLIFLLFGLGFNIIMNFNFRHFPKLFVLVIILPHAFQGDNRGQNTLTVSTV